MSHNLNSNKDDKDEGLATVLISDPHAFKDGYVSVMRNIFLTSSIGIALISSSNNFKRYKKYMMVVAILIIIYSIGYGIVASFDSYEYINILKKEKHISKLHLVVLKNWDKWIKISYIYMALIAAVSILVILLKVY
jgi:hypothetical protein